MGSSTFSRSVLLPVSAADAFAWHERQGALERLIPPWEHIEVIERSGGISDGGRVVLRQHAGPASLLLEAHHFGYIPGKEFSDRMVRGPFSRWEHRHTFESRPEDGGSMLTDSIEYNLAGGALTSGYVQTQLKRMFAYRHAVTKADLDLWRQWAGLPRLRILVTGASGLVGRTLCPMLSTMGHQVIRLVRQAPAVEDEVDLPRLGYAGPIDAVVHLAGENVAGGRWTAERRRRIRESREQGTRALVAALGKLPSTPRIFLGASAVGFYGSRGDEICGEGDGPGKGFLSEVCQAWERETLLARAFGARVVCLRIGIVLSPAGGALGKLLPLFEAGLGGPIADGRMWMSWISIDDLAGTIIHSLMDEGLSGSVNAVAPEPVQNAEFARELGRVVQRPAMARVPAVALRAIYGQMAEETLLSSTRVQPAVLLERGYEFRHPKIAKAFCHVLGRSSRSSE